jgi:hypothetical protein
MFMDRTRHFLFAPSARIHAYVDEVHIEVPGLTFGFTYFHFAVKYFKFAGQVVGKVCHGLFL